MTTEYINIILELTWKLTLLPVQEVVAAAAMIEAIAVVRKEFNTFASKKDVTLLLFQKANVYAMVEVQDVM
jgi:hypothetical protein